MSDYLNNSSDNPVPNLIKKSWPILEDHPVNISRKEAGLNEANSIWLWGQGKAPSIPLFKDLYGLKGGVISAVDLIKGIGIYAGFRPIYVEGATGYLDTNYIGKAQGALNGLHDLDFIFLHVEAPDEASHNGNYKEKIQAIEAFDREVVGVVLEGLKEFEDYRVMVVSDHFTPIVKKTHTDDLFSSFFYSLSHGRLPILRYASKLYLPCLLLNIFTGGEFVDFHICLKKNIIPMNCKCHFLIRPVVFENIRK